MSFVAGDVPVLQERHGEAAEGNPRRHDSKDGRGT